MQFKKFLLDDYLQTDDGKKCYEFFQNIKDIFFHDQKRFFDFVDSWLTTPSSEYFLGLREGDSEKSIAKPQKFSSFTDFAEKKVWKKENIQEPRKFQKWVPYVSLFWYFCHTEYVFPYLFPMNFYKLKEVFEKFEIPLPQLPGHMKHFERCIYYFELCRALYEFRQRYGLTPVELCVFLYGFAPRFLENFLVSDLPEANRIYIVGANEGDVEYYLSKPLADSEITAWQGNEEMLPGDIVLIYETTPFSRIGSVWRAVSPGFDDPFHYYPGKVYLSHPIKIPYLYFNALLHDPVWGKKPLVKAHMQGVNGKPVTCEEYEALKRMIKQRDPRFDLNRLPNPPLYSQFYREDLQTEKDIEEMLLNPLLEKLGYNIKKEFVRQFPIRMGRGIRYYPDYALHASGKNGGEHADFIWEAKYRIPTKKQLLEDFGKAKSYAMRLGPNGVGLVSMEGIWVVAAEDHFNFEKLKKYSWEELEDPEIFAVLKAFLYRLAKPKR